MLSLADPDAAVAEVDSLIERGARIVHVRPAPVPGPNGTLALARRPLARSGVGAARRGVDPRRVPPRRQRLQRRSRRPWGGDAVFGFGNTNVLSRMLVSDRAIHDTIASLVVHGVFTRHPTLRVASIENGSDWIALLVKRLRKQANQTPWAFADDPLDTIRRARLGHAVLRGGPRARSPI